MRQMRRKDRELPAEEGYAILDEAIYGTLALGGEEGPYAVALNHVRVDGTVYFHCAREGLKIDLMRADPRACYSVVSLARVEDVGQTMYYRSAVVRGNLRECAPEEARVAAVALLARFCGGAPLPEGWDEAMFLALDVASITAKSNPLPQGGHHA